MKYKIFKTKVRIEFLLNCCVVIRQSMTYSFAQPSELYVSLRVCHCSLVLKLLLIRTNFWAGTPKFHLSIHLFIHLFPLGPLGRSSGFSGRPSDPSGRPSEPSGRPTDPAERPSGRLSDP